jgi:cytochrome c553
MATIVMKKSRLITQTAVAFFLASPVTSSPPALAIQAQTAPLPPNQQPAPGNAGQFTSTLPTGIRLVGSTSDLMINIFYPLGDEVFYIGRNPPQNDKEWNAYEGRMLILAEAGNLLMMPGRARDQGRWMRDARLMVDAGVAALQAAKARDVAALEKLNDQLYNACVICHQDYRPNYRTRVPDPDGLPPLQSPPQK